MKRMIKWVVPPAVIGLGLALFSLSFVRPLVPSQAYVITATLDGRPIHGMLLKPLMMRNLYYVHLPESHPRYQWFGIARQREVVFVPVGVRSGWLGIRYIHTDQAHGVRLTDSKIEDRWDLAFSASGVDFSNGSIFVSIDRHP